MWMQQHVRDQAYEIIGIAKLVLHNFRPEGANMQVFNNYFNYDVLPK